MAHKNSVAVYIDGINRTSNTVMPFKYGDFLDERLDESIITLKAVKKEVFTPLTPVEVRITNEKFWGLRNKVTEKVETQTKYFIIANDTATEFQLGKKLYNHDLYCIEATKITECFAVDTITFTNDMGRMYTANATWAEIKIT